MIEVPVVECVAGRGIRGDRYFDFKNDYKGQITFFRWKFSMNFAARCKSRLLALSCAAQRNCPRRRSK